MKKLVVAALKAEDAARVKSTIIAEELGKVKCVRQKLTNIKEQQRTILQETFRKRDSMNKWVQQQRQETEDWCRKQRAAMHRERQHLVRKLESLRDGIAPPSRSERVETEGLKATIVKLRASAQQLRKLSRANECRLRKQLNVAHLEVRDLREQCRLLESKQTKRLEDKSKGHLVEKKRLYETRRRNDQLLGQIHRTKHLENNSFVEGYSEENNIIQVHASSDDVFSGSKISACVKAQDSDRNFDAFREVGVEESSRECNRNDDASILGSVRDKKDFLQNTDHSEQILKSKEMSQQEKYPYKERQLGSTFAAPIFVTSGEGASQNSVDEERSSSIDIQNCNACSSQNERSDLQTFLHPAKAKDECCGHILTSYENGTHEQKFPDGLVIVNFRNGDIKKTLPNGIVTYFYASVKVC